MNVFYIVRHGETENNKAGRLSGWIDTPLTSQGLAPTKIVADKLSNISFDKIYSSDLGRAFITAYELAKLLSHHKDIIRLPGLREVNYGDYANMFSAEVYEKFPKVDSDTHYIPKNGESLDHMQKRVFQTVMELNRQHKNAEILLVCHSGVMAALNAKYLDHDFGEHNISEAYPHDYVGTFSVDNNKITYFEEFNG
jgi:broad specificity phosphatase PhoE